jgi:hypothetical protein
VSSHLHPQFQVPTPTSTCLVRVQEPCSIVCSTHHNAVLLHVAAFLRRTVPLQPGMSRLPVPCLAVSPAVSAQPSPTDLAPCVMQTCALCGVSLCRLLLHCACGLACLRSCCRIDVHGLVGRLVCSLLGVSRFLSSCSVAALWYGRLIHAGDLRFVALRLVLAAVSRCDHIANLRASCFQT